MKNRSSKVMAIVALIIAVIGLGMGFAAFSNVWTISSSATVTPDSSTFKVVFSSIINGVDTSEIVPTKTPTTLVASNGIIDNTSTPTITNLKADFTAPGQKAVYDFYVYNAGEYTAYLNSIRFNGAKKCTAGKDANDSLVQAACNGIKVTVNVGGVTATDTMLGITAQHHSSKKLFLTFKKITLAKPSEVC